MTQRHLQLESLALSVLAGRGIAAIWQLHVDAAAAHRTGYPAAAYAILELAEAAERMWLLQEDSESAAFSATGTQNRR
jgi:hypothetical protein